ncbi:hypothetical protein P4S95_04085 [Aneurinibacillus aneurinilyticus]|uniref:hypothetical protein n=1 Tax=Aneurinibacillus aneurinilyticus TaxID=1391 RepID=UPI002E1A9748|nr:hypothetical protein [Aneurinibacillus aneurinilyticus]
MELENWLLKYNVKKMTIDNYNNYIKSYKLEEPEDYAKVFKDKDITKIDIVFHSVSYVINYWYVDEYKYISAKLRLKYDGCGFAEYEAIYDMNGITEDDYFRKI